MGSRRDDWVTLSGYHIVHATDRAVLLEPCDTPGAGQTWIPRSHILDGDTLAVGDTDIAVKSWIAEREGLL